MFPVPYRMVMDANDQHIKPDTEEKKEIDVH